MILYIPSVQLTFRKYMKNKGLRTMHKIRMFCF